MKPIVREAVFALLAWALPFASGVCLFAFKSSQPLLFDTLMGVALAASTVSLGVLYLRRKRGNYLAYGVRIGVIWTITNLLLDGLMFSSGPMKMSLPQYMMDIGLAYLAIPIITIGLGLAAAHASTLAGRPRDAEESQ